MEKTSETDPSVPNCSKLENFMLRYNNVLQPSEVVFDDERFRKESTRSYLHGFGLSSFLQYNLHSTNQYLYCYVLIFKIV
jgi:hypothetical protein